jgi:hypothetical protein
MPTGLNVNPNCGCRKSVAIVTVADDTPNETTCLWPGKIAVFDDEASAFCSDPFSEGNDCWLMVLNSNLGSFASTKADLHVGEHYLGRPVGVIPTEQEVGDPIDVPIFAIRIEENEIYICEICGRLSRPGRASSCCTNCFDPSRAPSPFAPG